MVMGNVAYIDAFRSQVVNESLPIFLDSAVYRFSFFVLTGLKILDQIGGGVAAIAISTTMIGTCLRQRLLLVLLHS
jgi:hypothetical protein